MLNIEQLSKQVSYDETESGNKLYNVLRERDYPIQKIIGMVYRAGRLSERPNTNKEINRLHWIIHNICTSIPEAKSFVTRKNDFDWDGAQSVKIYSVGTALMGDYGRSGPASGNWSRYGDIQNLEATTQAMTLTKDRAFTFAIDKRDENETARQLSAASALARQLRQVVIPEVDGWVYQQMCDLAGNKPTALALTSANIYGEIIKGTNALDNAEVPDTGRVLLITPDTYLLMKQSPDIVMETDIGSDMRVRGVIANLDGMAVIRVPASRFPSGFGFMLVHPVATVAPTKLADYRVHTDPPGVSGSLVEGRIAYDAFVLENKAKALYYQATA